MQAGVVDLGVEPGKVGVGNLRECERAVSVRGLVAVLAGQDGVGKLDALVGARKMGAGVESRAITRHAEDARKRGGGGALAVGAGNQDGRDARLRIAEVRAERAHMGQIEFADGTGAGRGGKLGGQGVQVVNRFCVSHGRPV